MPLRKESFLHAIISSVGWKIGERGTSFIKHIVIASAIGLSTQLDVYYMVIGLLGVLVFSLGGLVEILAVPALVAHQQKGEDAEFHAVASGVFQITLMMSLLLTILVFGLRELIAEIAIGFDAAQKAQIAEGFFWVLPMLLLHIPKSYLLSLLRAKRHFSISYQAEFILGVVSLACIVIWWRVPHVLLWSISIATIASFLYALAFCWRDVLPIQYLNTAGRRAWQNPFAPAVVTVFALAPGLLLLQGANFITALTDRVYLSFLDEGAISALVYAIVLVRLLPGAAPLDGSFLTVLAEEKTSRTRNQKFNDLVSLSIAASVLVGGFFLVAGEETIRFLFERGLFDDEATRSVTIALVAVSPLVLPLFIIPLFDIIFQVEKRISTLVVRVAVGIVCNLVLNWIALFVLGWGLFGIALATTLSNWFMMLAAAQAARRLGYQINFWRHLAWGLWLLGWLLAALIALYLAPATTGLVYLVMSGLGVSVAVGLGGLLYVGGERRLIVGVIQRVLGRVVAMLGR